MPAARHDRLRFCGEHDGVSAGRCPEHGGDARDGARAAHAYWRRNLSPWRFLVPGHDWRFHLDGAVVPAVVRSNRQSAGKISHLQGLEPASVGGRAAMNIDVDKSRVMAEIEELALISDAEAPAVTRIVFTPTDLKARVWLTARCEEAGLAVRQDAIGNIFARWTGTEPNAPAVGTGSHIDAIPNAGKYDGVVGVLGELKATRSHRRSGFRP